MFRLPAVVALVACGDNVVEDMQSGSRLRLIRYELADGSSDVDRTRFHDAERREDCVVRVFSSGTRRCMPTSAGGSVVFTEDTCHRVLGATASPEPPGYFIRSFSLRGESSPSRLYHAGVVTSPPTFLWEQRDEYCLGPFSIDPRLTFYTLGDEIPADELVAIHSDDTVTDGRLTIAIDESSDGWRMPGAITDDVAGTCELAGSANAEAALCVPRRRTTLFGDVQCTQPLAVGEVAAHRDVDSGCWSLLEPGEAFTAMPYERIGETCVAVSANQPLFVPAATRDVAALPRRRARADTRLIPIDIGELTRDAFVHDRELAADCRFEPNDDGVYACTPYASVDVLTYFRDATCSAPIDVAFVPTGTCELPSLFAGNRRIGPVHPAPIYELTTGDRCAVYAPPSRFAVHTLEDIPAHAIATRKVD